MKKDKDGFDLESLIGFRDSVKEKKPKVCEDFEMIGKLDDLINSYYDCSEK